MNRSERVAVIDAAVRLVGSGAGSSSEYAAMAGRAKAAGLHGVADWLDEIAALRLRYELAASLPAIRIARARDSPN